MFDISVHILKEMTLTCNSAFTLSSAFPCPIASYKAITLCLHPFLSVCRLFTSVCLRLSFCFSVTKAGYLPTLCIHVYLLK